VEWGGGEGTGLTMEKWKIVNWKGEIKNVIGYII
jgi:hypothetical protein